jgi:CHASE3 domain sensor protein
MPFERLRHRKRMLVVLGILVPVLLVGFPAFLAHHAKSELAASRRELAHAVDVSRRVDNLLACLTEAETGQRGFLLTGNSTYLEPYQAAMQRLSGELDGLRTTLADDQPSLARFGRLSEEAKTKLAELAETIRLQLAGKHLEALALVSSNRGQQCMERIRSVIRDIKEDIRKEVLDRQQRLESRARFAEAVLWSLVALAAVFSVVVLYLLHRLSSVQIIAHMCAWSRTIEYEGEWISFEDYLKRRFNIDTSHGMSPVESEKFLKSLGVADTERAKR